MSQFRINVKNHSQGNSDSEPIIPDNVVPEPIPDSKPDPKPDSIPDSDSNSNNIIPEIIVPNTGQNTNERPSIMSNIPMVILPVLMAIIVLALFVYRYFKKSYACGFRKIRLSIIIILAIFSALLSFFAIANANESVLLASATQDDLDTLNEERILSISVANVDLNIDINKENVYTAIPHTIKVESDTTFGYTLSVYASGDVIADKENHAINSISSDQTVLSDNTWGVSLVEPVDETSSTWHSIPTSEEEALVIKNGHQSTLANDETTIYYGVYLTPEIPSGTYTSPTLNYIAISNLPPETTIVFNANGGTGDMANQTFYNHITTALSANTFTNDDLEFSSWNTEPDGTGNAYANEAEVLNLTPDGGEIILYAQWVACGPNKICYDSNGAADIALSKQLVDSDSSATLWAPNLERQGYGFIGWSENKDAVPGVSTIYGPNETITTGNLSMGGIHLYAIWLASSGNLQNWICPNNTSFPIGSVTALTDIRDNNTYAVAKLADGHCWLIENLRLGKDVEMELTTENTQTAGTLPASSSGWNVVSSAYAKYLNTNNLQFSNQTINSTDSPIYSYGNYYTWSTAVNYDSSTFNTLESSICPAGWGLPGGSGGSYYGLDSSLGGNGQNRDNDPSATTIWRQYPNNFVYSGLLSNYVDNRGSNAIYWSRSNYDSTSAYRLYFSATSINFSNAQKGFGGAVRCIALE